jgi:hypothetical protein
LVGNTLNHILDILSAGPAAFCQPGFADVSYATEISYGDRQVLDQLLTLVFANYLWAQVFS